MNNILKFSEDGKSILGVNDSSITSITIPDNVTTIEDWAFSRCTALQSIDVSKKNPKYASLDGVLYDKELKTIIKFPCNKRITEYNIPNCVTTIGNSAFWGCSALQSIDIPNSVTTIEKYAFNECTALQSIDIPNSVTTIGEEAFRRCSALQSIDIPNSVTTIEDWAFIGCSALQSINIRITDIENVNISEWAFNSIDTNNCVLYIPPGTLWAYRFHPVFGKFKNIEIEKQD